MHLGILPWGIKSRTEGVKLKVWVKLFWQLQNFSLLQKKTLGFTHETSSPNDIVHGIQMHLKKIDQKEGKWVKSEEAFFQEDIVRYCFFVSKITQKSSGVELKGVCYNKLIIYWKEPYAQSFFILPNNTNSKGCTCWIFFRINDFCTWSCF